jgi:hypothetical protein
MEPIYFAENRYSYLTGNYKPSANSVFAVQTPENLFEQHIQELFIEGQEHLQHEEYTLALQRLQEAMSLILRIVHPAMPIDHIYWYKPLTFPFDISILDVLLSKSLDILQKTPVPIYALPANIVNLQSALSPQVQESLKPFTNTGIKTISFHENVQANILGALEAAKTSDWPNAIKLYETALTNVPASEAKVRGGMEHDLAVLYEKAGNRPRAQELGINSIKSFEIAKDIEAQVQALSTTVGIMERAGSGQQTADLKKKLDVLSSTNNFNPVFTTTVISPQSITKNLLTPAVTRRTSGRLLQPASSPETQPTALTATRQPVSFSQDAPELISTKYLSVSAPQKMMTISGLSSSLSIKLDNNPLANAKAFMTSLSVTKDIGLLTSWLQPIQFVAYIPHMYFFVIPMSIGDCHYGMGDLQVAFNTYFGVLNYPFINKNYEIVKVWTKLAQTTLDMGDEAYRKAKDNPALFVPAKAFYEKIILTNKTISAASPLYSQAKFADIKLRVTNFLAAPDPLVVVENPAITTIVLNAYSKLQQIQAGLNFFGFGLDYTPPFSFEYLQNTARYFAQHASQIEQRYIQYKSQAENEEFRREQLNQQAEVARESVILEQRGVAEAQKGIDVANAGVAYATAQVQAAQGAQTDFNNVRYELLELTQLEAWANASSVDRDDQVKLTITGYEYFSSDSERRNVVLQRLALQKAQISQELEANKLARAIASAQAYKGMATAQVAQANARKAIAEQRVTIAKLQEKQTMENRDFLDMREFGARLWYELAQQAKRIKQRYLDMATEIAFLMERAYNAETERNLSVIRYDYDQTSSGNLMGADLLSEDIDYFTYDHITTTKTKKIPVKKTISIADNYPTQFNLLKTKGKCSFETVLADFDREHPGFYLAKIRNVELVFVGIAGTRSIAGTLRNVGVSRFRRPGGAIIERLYPADVMALSQYEIRQDSLAFRFNPNDLRLFENNGIDTLWQLDLPLSANDFDYSEILDVHLVLYYDGFFSLDLETSIKAALPASGTAAQALSMKVSTPDELFYLKNKGEAEIVFDDLMFPRNQKDLLRKTTTIKLTGTPLVIKNLKIRMTCAALPSEIIVQSDGTGEINDIPVTSLLKGLQNKSIMDTWKWKITGADNPHLVQNGVLDLSKLNDIMIFTQYSFNYR